MVECAILHTCPFVKIYEADRTKKFVLQGFIRMYCQGEKQEECVRKIVGYTLGDDSKVPTNMMPNGLPISGTSHSEWPHDVMAVVRSARVMRIKTGHY